MGWLFWVKRTITVFIAIFGVLVTFELLKGHKVPESIDFALFWGILSTTVFICSRLYQSRKGIACDLCNDIPKNDK